MQCSGITQKNQRCKRKALKTELFCHTHSERSEPASETEIQQCPICFDMHRKQKLFDCQHSVCCECYSRVKKCPLCRYPKFGQPMKTINLEIYRNIITENVLIMLRDYVAGFTSRMELVNYTARLLSNRFRRYDYLRGVYVLLTSKMKDDVVMDKMIQIILYQN